MRGQQQQQKNLNWLINKKIHPTSDRDRTHHTQWVPFFVLFYTTWNRKRDRNFFIGFFVIVSLNFLFLVWKGTLDCGNDMATFLFIYFDLYTSFIYSLVVGIDWNQEKRLDSYYSLWLVHKKSPNRNFLETFQSNTRNHLNNYTTGIFG